MKRQTKKSRKQTEVRRRMSLENMEKRELFAVDLIGAGDALLASEQVSIRPEVLGEFEITSGLILCGSPTASMSGSTLKVDGTWCNDNLEVRLKQNDPSRIQVVNLVNNTTQEFAAHTVNRIEVKLKAGNDRVRINADKLRAKVVGEGGIPFGHTSQ